MSKATKQTNQQKGMGLMGSLDIRGIAEKLLDKTGVHFLTSSPYGETQLAMELAVKVALEDCDVLYVCLNFGEKVVYGILEKITHTTPPTLSLQTHWKGTPELEAWIYKHDAAALIIIDSFSRITEAELQELHSISRTLVVCCLVVKHSRRGELEFTNLKGEVWA
jgi:hypothetical protein